MAPKMGHGHGHARVSAGTTPPMRKEPADSLDLSGFISALEQEIGDLHSTIKSRRDDRVEKAFQRVPRNMRRRTASHNARRVPRRLRQQSHRDQAADNTPSVASGLAKRKKARTASAWVHENTKKRIKLQEEKKLARGVNGGGDAEGDDNDDEGEGEEEGDSTAGCCPRRPLPIKNLQLPTHRWQSKRAQMDNPGFLWNTTLVRTPANKTYRMSLRAASVKPGMCTCWDTSYKPTIYLQGPVKQLDEALAIVVEPHLLTTSLRSGASCVDVKLPRSFNYQHQQHAANQGFELSGPGNCGAMTLFYNPTTETTTTTHDDTQRSAFLRVHPTLFSHVWTALNNGIARKQLPVIVRDYRLEIGSIDLTGSGALEMLASIIYPYETKTAPMEPQGREFLKLRSIDTTALASSSGAMLAFNIQDPRLDEPKTAHGVQGNSQGQAKGPSRNIHSILQDWPSDNVARYPSGLFDKMARHTAKKLAPQTTLDKRRGKLSTNERLLLETNPECRPIPVIVAAADGASSVPAAADPHASSKSSTASPSWTIIAPRACIDAIWQRLHLQRSQLSGQQPMPAGLEEERHMALERGRPWFPADFPGTPTGWDWELQSRRRQEKTWNEKPTAKRTQWKAVDLGNGNKGELGSGFACDWEFLFGVDTVPAIATTATVAENASEGSEKRRSQKDNDNDKSFHDKNGHTILAEDTVMDVSEPESEVEPVEPVDSAKLLHEDIQFAALQPQSKAMPAIVRSLQHATWNDVRDAVQTARLHKPVEWRTPYQLMTISVELLRGGVHDARARIYRLPTDSYRDKWLALANTKTPKTQSHNRRPPMPQRMPADADIATRKKLMAQSLLETRLPYPRPTGTGDDDTAEQDLHLPIPGRDDLIGFLTSGALRFLTSKGAGIGHVSAQKLVEAILAGDKTDAHPADDSGTPVGGRVPISRDARLCIVRNAGERVGHLARWTPISN
ncbi:Ribonucleases P/MRP protein subunit pop1 [Sporothrix stenoceras]|uniref:Ribonucleases P/MRP protein subunit pop1 n=1 Tax=Sporothrix stenoceras TaxID=5173 RepID=A0ABR3YSH6_9PEZI